MNKITKQCLASLALSVMLTACDNDGDQIFVSQIPDTDIATSAGDIVLDENRLDMLALTVYWGDNGQISLSDPEVAAPLNALTNTLQMSVDENFSTAFEETLGSGVTSRQFTTSELNSAALRAGMESGSTSTVFMRLKSVLGVNVPPRYSNVITFRLTTYKIDLTIGTVLDSNMGDTGRTLALTDKADVYAGFFNASSWENWYFRDPSGVIWGTAADLGKAFVLGSSAKCDIWNNWFPEPAGCYYTVVDIPANEWTALLIPSLTISGDLDGTMEYDRRNNVWSYTFNADAKTYNVKISGLGNQYNSEGGDGAPASTDIPVGFGGTSDALTFGSTASTVSFDVDTAGETTVLLSLADPKHWTLAVGESAPVEEVAQQVYLLGIVDPWGFNDYLRLYNEDTKSYGGCHYVDSQWGYQVGIEVDNWGDVYKMVDGGTAYEGSLVFQGENNITAPEAGDYIFDISLGSLYYKLVKLESVSVTGMNDDWNLHEMTPGEASGIYTYEFTKTAETPWGVKIVFNGDWNLFYGGNGNNGELCYNHDGFTGDNDFEIGSTIVLTVDIYNATYSYTQK